MDDPLVDRVLSRQASTDVGQHIVIGVAGRSRVDVSREEGASDLISASGAVPFGLIVAQLSSVCSGWPSIRFPETW